MCKHIPSDAAIVANESHFIPAIPHTLCSIRQRERGLKETSHVITREIMELLYILDHRHSHGILLSFSLILCLGALGLSIALSLSHKCAHRHTSARVKIPAHFSVIAPLLFQGFISIAFLSEHFNLQA